MKKLLNGELMDMTDAEVAAAQEALGRIGAGPPRSLLKTTIIGRCTDEELDDFNTWLTTSATLRQRMRWDNSVEINSADTEVRAVLTALFGEPRMLEILA